MEKTESPGEDGSAEKAMSYVMIHNIPKSYRACDLRNFFSQLVETGAFRCFHYRHRPEVQEVAATNTRAEESNEPAEASRRNTCCCLVMIRRERLEDLLGSYDKAFWVNRQGESLSSRCHIRRIAVAEDEATSSGTYLRPVEKRQQRHRPILTRSDLKQMIELRPPVALPAGNVGTPTSYILRQINACNFPAQLIGKLGIEFPRLRAKGIYGSVPLDYETSRVGAGFSQPAGTSTGATQTLQEADDHLNVSAGCSANRTIVSGEKSKNSQRTVTLDGKQENSGSTNGAENISAEPTKVTNVSRKNYRAAKSRHPKLSRPPPDLSSIPTADEIPTFIRTRKGHVISSFDPEAVNGGPTKTKDAATDGLPNQKSKQKKGSKVADDHQPNSDDESQAKRADVDELSDSNDGEEWDRHEALHNDVTSQERTKERLFEEEQEVVWEKGGSGLVFYTDAQYWDEAEGDFDAKTSDDWDIDTSVYYQDGAGDKDARDFVSLEHFRRLHDGKYDEDDNRVGYFENFTRGFGRRILEAQGWSEGRGVGGGKEGPSEPIQEDGQHPRDRSGFGYRGEKLIRNVDQRGGKRRRETEWYNLFSSVYDERFAEGEDPARHDRAARSQEPTLLKYRKVFVKTSKNSGEADKQASS